jgi:hypothetical protein
VREGQEHKVYRLYKALYGLKQAPRVWNIKLDSTLRKHGFIQSPLEHVLYAKGKSESRLLIGVYVDDLIVIGSCNKMTSEFKKQLQEELKMSDLGSLNFYLGIEVH